MAKIASYARLGFHPNLQAVLIGLLVVVVMIVWPKKWGARVPGSLVGIILATVVSALFRMDSIATVGDIPRTLMLADRLDLGGLNLDMLKNLISPVVTIAALGMIESLLCGASASRMKNEPFNADQELIAQGVGNMLLPLFGGVPATAAIARTSVAVKSGQQTRLASVFHSVFLLASMFLLGGVMARLPLAALAGVLMVTAWRMNDWSGIRYIFSHKLKSGITAIQMDLKIHGLTPEIIKEAFAKTHKARNYILDEVMLPVIAEPRPELSKYAPKMLSTIVPVDKIREVIGSGGKVIQKICAECDVTIDIEDDGHCYVAGIDIEKCRRAMDIIDTIVNDPEPGSYYSGRVTRIMDFGAFVEIAPGKEGLVHISQLDIKRTENVTDVVNVGDIVKVKVLEIDDKGRLNLSRREALIDLDGAVPENVLPEKQPRRERSDRPRGDRPRRDRNDRH